MYVWWLSPINIILTRTTTTTTTTITIINSTDNRVSLLRHAPTSEQATPRRRRPKNMLIPLSSMYFCALHDVWFRLNPHDRPPVTIDPPRRPASLTNSALVLFSFWLLSVISRYIETFIAIIRNAAMITCVNLTRGIEQMQVRQKIELWFKICLLWNVRFPFAFSDNSVEFNSSCPTLTPKVNSGKKWGDWKCGSGKCNTGKIARVEKQE